MHHRVESPARQIAESSTKNWNANRAIQNATNPVSKTRLKSPDSTNTAASHSHSVRPYVCIAETISPDAADVPGSGSPRLRRNLPCPRREEVEKSGPVREKVGPVPRMFDQNQFTSYAEHAGNFPEKPDTRLVELGFIDACMDIDPAQGRSREAFLQPAEVVETGSSLMVD